MSTIEERRRQLKEQIEGVEKSIARDLDAIEVEESNISKWPARVARGASTQDVADGFIAKSRQNIALRQQNIAILETKLAQLKSDLAQLPPPEPPPPPPPPPPDPPPAAPPSVDSAGDIAVNNANARAEGAQTQNPQSAPGTATEEGIVVTPPDTVTTTNAAPAIGNAASGGVRTAPESLPNNTASSAGNVATASGPPATTVSTPAAPDNTNSLINTFGTSSATQSYIYLASKVTHYFKGGKFTQQLEGKLVQFDLTPQGNTASGNQTDSNQSAAETARLNRTVPVLPGPTPRQDPVVPPAAPEISNPSTPGTDTGAPPDDSAPFTPGESNPPTSGGVDVAVPPAPTPPSSITVAGATLEASLQISGRVFISLTLPSGRSEINVDGWGNEQWDSLITTLTDTADITAANSIKASWPTLQAQLRASVQPPAATAAPSQNMAKEA